MRKRRYEVPKCLSAKQTGLTEEGDWEKCEDHARHWDICLETGKKTDQQRKLMGRKPLGSQQTMAGDKVGHKEVNGGGQFAEMHAVLSMKTGPSV